MFKRFGEFLAKTDRTTALLLPDTADTNGDIWVFSMHTDDGEYGLIFAVHTAEEQVTNIRAREHNWIFRHLDDGDFADAPQFIRGEIDERVEIVEDPRDLAILKDTCARCQIDYLADVVPKVDLQIDGLYAQRIIREYCPECGGPLGNRRTINPPQEYTMEWHTEVVEPEDQLDPEEVDLSDHTWEYARI